MKPETMMIDDVKYVRADSVENCKIDENSEAETYTDTETDTETETEVIKC